MIGSNEREGDGVLNWSPTDGINKILSDLITLTFFDCPISLEAS